MSNTVSITFPDDEYAQLKALAEEQDRYISGQARHMLRAALKAYAEASVPRDLPDRKNPEGWQPDASPDATLGEQERVQPPLGPPLTSELGKEPLLG
jgi:hypothetical protein